MEKNDTPLADTASLPAIEARWGRSTASGFTALPNTLIKAQGELGLKDGELVVLTNLAMHWWSPTAPPFPRTETIAKRMGVTARSVQRHLNSLEKGGFIARVMGRGRSYYDLTGLKEKLEKITPRHAWQQSQVPGVKTIGKGGDFQPRSPDG